MSCGLVLLPGMDGTGKLFAPLQDALGPDISVTVVRYPDEPLDYPAHIQIARAALPRDLPYVVLGESFSGPIAIALAATAPPGMVGYALCASFVRSPRVILSILRPVLGMLPARHVPAGVAQYFLMGRHASESLRRQHAEVLRGVSSKALAARLKAIATIDMRQQLAAVRMPGIYLRATRDRLVSRSASREFASIAADSRIIDVEGPHFLLQTQPRAVATIVKAFLAECLTIQP